MKPVITFFGGVAGVTLLQHNQTLNLIFPNFFFGTNFIFALQIIGTIDGKKEIWKSQSGGARVMHLVYTALFCIYYYKYYLKVIYVCIWLINYLQKNITFKCL